MTAQLAHICVVGAGTMGRGIAQVALSAGHEVTLVDPDGRQLQAAADEIRSRLSRKKPDGAAAISSRLTTVTIIVESVDRPDTVVVEAVVEDLSVKHRVLTEAYKHFGSTCVLATNTSSLSVTEIAAGVPEPSRVVGMHFFNPVPVMRLVEVVDGLQSDPEVIELIDRLTTAWGKRVARVHSSPGFIVNRVARAFYGEALKLLEEKAASVAEIDLVMRGSGQFRMGPFELIDLIGLEVNLAVTNTVWTAYNNDPRFAPSRIQAELVSAGRLGRKTGHGFYRYDGEASTTADGPREDLAEVVLPTKLRLAGGSPQLRRILDRSGIDFELVDSASDYIVVPEVGTVLITRGYTAAEEAERLGTPVAVLDRCIDPSRTTALAFTTSDDSMLLPVVGLLDRAGITAVRIADTPGLIVARVLSMVANEAWETAFHGVASPEDIDAAMVLGTNYPIGPFQWCSEWGPGYVLEVLDALWAAYHDGRYRASQRLRAHAKPKQK